MKNNKKLKVVLTSFTLLLLSTSLVYAVTSNDYLNKANQYIQSSCNKKIISSETGIICYLFYKLGEVETKTSSNTSRITVLENATLPTAQPTQSPQKKLKTYDNNGNLLGLFIDRSSFFLEDKNLIVTLSESQIGSRKNVWYTDGSCTGTPYMLLPYPLQSLRAYQEAVNELYVLGPGRYYSIDRSDGVTITANSYQSYDGVNYPCLSTSTIGGGWTLTPVNLSFTEPINLPLQFKFE